MPKKKILFVRPTLGQGGADRVTLQLLKHIDRDAYQPELALLHTSGVFLDEVPEDVPVHSLGARNLWFTTRPLAKLIKKGEYDVIYSTSTGTNIPACLVRWLYRLPGTFVISERNTVNRGDGIKQRLLAKLKKTLYRKADWVTAVSEAIRKQILDQFSVAPNKAVVVHNPLIDDALHTAKQQSVEHPHFESHIPVILAAGRMVDAKNFTMLMESFKLVLDNQDARLCILGDGPKLDHLKKQACDLGIDSKVSFPGFDKNPYKFMSACDVFVLSSNFEGMPGVLIQALACGAPCIATDCPTGPSEIIKDGENGFLIPVRDPASLSKRILNLLEDSALKNQFRANGPTSVKRFETAQAIETYVNFLD
ncbi:MAG: glycosyltransferase [Planctomycetota bacterium]|nr:glycosyltransferase [Planctomycetota bacterium]